MFISLFCSVSKQYCTIVINQTLSNEWLFSKVFYKQIFIYADATLDRTLTMRESRSNFTNIPKITKLFIFVQKGTKNFIITNKFRTIRTCLNLVLHISIILLYANHSWHYAIVLKLSGDIEENPGPKPSPNQSLSQEFQQYFCTLLYKNITFKGLHIDS